MKWHRLKCSDSKDLGMPNRCPNFLRSPASTHVRLHRSLLLGTSALTYEISWPFCEKCAKTYARFRRYRNFLGIFPAAGILISAFVIAMPDFEKGAVNRAMQCVGWAFAIAVGGCLTAWLFQAFSSPIDGRLTNLPTVRINRGGKKAFSSKHFFDMAFKNPVYLKELIELNRHRPMEYDAIGIDLAIEKNERKQQLDQTE